MNEVVNATKIREPVLTALEEDRYTNLPALYVKSFLSSYAECLGMGPIEIITIHQRYAEKLSFSKERELKHPSTTRIKKPNVRLLVISAFVVLLMTLVAYALFI